MGVIVLVADQDTLARPAHSMGSVMLFQSLQSGQNRWIFLRLRLFNAESIVRQRIKPDRLGLVCVERQRLGRGVAALQRCGGDC